MIQVTASRVPTQLHLPEQRRQPKPHKTNHQINSQKYHARSHAVMRGRKQAKLHRMCRPGDPELYQNPKTNRDNIHSNAKANVTAQTPHEVAMQNGKLSGGSQWRTLGVPPPHCKSNHKSHMAALIRKLDRAPCSWNARAKHRHQHHCLHQEKPGTT
jgi:hypothetical protein